MQKKSNTVKDIAIIFLVVFGTKASHITTDEHPSLYFSMGRVNAPGILPLYEVPSSLVTMLPSGCLFLSCPLSELDSSLTVFSSLTPYKLTASPSLCL